MQSNYDDKTIQSVTFTYNYQIMYIYSACLISILFAEKSLWKFKLLLFFSWPDLSMARSFHGQIFPWPDLFMARSFHGQIFPWPDLPMARSFHDQIFPWPDFSMARSFRLSNKISRRLRPGFKQTPAKVPAIRSHKDRRSRCICRCRWPRFCRENWDIRLCSTTAMQGHGNRGNQTIRHGV